MIDDDFPLWICACGELVEDTVHCPRCGSCPPWGCGGDHDEEEEAAEPWDFDPADP